MQPPKTSPTLVLSTVRFPSRLAAVLKAALLLTLCFGRGAWADGNTSPPPPAVYNQECGSCHVAYPANLLPKASWQRVMRGLDKHYGSDASLDAATQKQIDTWLQSYGGQGKRARVEPPQDRITRSAWFERKHREVSAATFKRASIKSAANCSACHRDAAKGDFEEDRVRIPK